jgi:periplasmic divalent cation tolerance protein
MDFPCVIFCTASSEEEAKKLSTALVNENLAACVNTVQGVRSVYRWQGEVYEATEWLLIIKSHKTVLDRMIQRIRSLHSYEVPEIIALPIVGGSEDYLNWLETNIG